MPVLSANSRSVHRALMEGGWQATSMIFSLLSWPYLGGLPDRGRSFSPSIPYLWNRFRQTETAMCDSPTFRAICLLVFPSAASRIALVLWTIRYSVVGLMFALSCFFCSFVRTIGVGGRMHECM